LFKRAGSARNSAGTALRAAAGFARDNLGRHLQWDGGVSKESSGKPDWPNGREAGRSHLVLNRSAVRRAVTDRVRSKPG